MKDHPQSIIIATGSTLSRTRLYQIGIAKVLNEINQNFAIQGYKNEFWQPFQKGVNYNAFPLRQENICKFENENLFDMGTTAKKRATGKKKAIADTNVKDYANDPFFIKKREAAVKILKKTGLPESFTKK